MKINGQYQWTDYLNAQLLHIQRNGLARVIQYGAFALMVLSFGTVFLMMLLGQFDFNIVYVLPVLLFLVIFPLYRYVFMPRQVKKIFTQQKELSLPIEFEFTETGLSTSNEVGHSNRPWTNFVKWKENKELFMLYHSDVAFTMIPKRFFADPQQIETIKAFLEQNKVSKAKSRYGVGCVALLILFIIIAAISYINTMRVLNP